MSEFRLRWVFPILVVGLLVGASRSRADDRPAKPKPAATPEEAFTRFADAVNSDKFADALPYVAEPGAGIWAAALDGLKALPGLRDALDKQFGKADSPDPLPDSEKVKDYLRESVYETKGSIRATTELAKDRARLTLWTMRPGLNGEKQAPYETLMDAVKGDDGWKLETPLPLGGRPIVTKATRKDKDGKDVDVYVETSPFDKEHKQLLPTPYAEGAEHLRAMKDFGAAVVAEMGKQADAIKDGKYKTRAEALDAIQKAIQELSKKYKVP